LYVAFFCRGLMRLCRSFHQSRNGRRARVHLDAARLYTGKVQQIIDHCL